jgi:hypothetical protein
MNSELQVMGKLVASYLSKELPEGLSGAEPSELAHRMEILHVGFEVRTKSILERDFPNLMAALSMEQWNHLGKIFSSGPALKQEHLGLLPESFAFFLTTQDLSEPQKQALEKDHKLFQCRNSKLLPIWTEKQWQDLQEESVFLLQPTVGLIAQKSSWLVLSRNRQGFFETEVSTKIGLFLSRLQTEILTASELMEEFTTERELSEFFVLAVQNCWLAQQKS